MTSVFSNIKLVKQYRLKWTLNRPRPTSIVLERVDNSWHKNQQGYPEQPVEEVSIEIHPENDLSSWPQCHSSVTHLTKPIHREYCCCCYYFESPSQVSSLDNYSQPNEFDLFAERMNITIVTADVGKSVKKINRLFPLFCKLSSANHDTFK